MKILLRLPNWLGDMVMSAAFLRAVGEVFAGDEVSVIVKKGLHDLLPFFPATANNYVFDKKESGGPAGVWRFGKTIAAAEKFDVFFSLPDSFSAALMGAATGATTRIGYRAQGRLFLLTEAYEKEPGLHRVEEYLCLLEEYTGHRATNKTVQLHHNIRRGEHLVVNINSEAQSRRLTVAKAVETIAGVRTSFAQPIYLIGAPAEAAFVDTVLQAVPDKSGIMSMAGKTSLPQLVELLASAQGVLTTDSGPAHLANALGTPTVVLFGAGREANTAPYNRSGLQTLRLGQLSCEPCVKNVCTRFPTPQCLERLATEKMIAALHQTMHTK